MNCKSVGLRLRRFESCTCRRCDVSRHPHSCEPACWRSERAADLQRGASL